MKRQFYSLIALAVLVSIRYGQSNINDSTSLFPFEQDSKWGYIDRNGNIVIEPQFDEAGFFSEGLAVVKVNKKYGYINTTGEIVINPQFDLASSFSEGLAAVRVGGLKTGKCGYIDKSGNLIIVPQFDGAAKFHDGLASVIVDKKFGFVDKTGDIVIKPQFDWTGNFSEGLAWVEVKKKYGYIDKTGNIIIKPQFDLAKNFCEGLAAVKMGEKYGFIDKTGNMVISPQFNDVRNFAEGLAAVTFREESLGFYTKRSFIDKTGRIIIDLGKDLLGFGLCLFPADWIFSEGLAFVYFPDNKKWGFIDKTGNVVIKPQFNPEEWDSPSLLYDRVCKFSQGLALVRIGDKWDYIDRNGTTTKERLQIYKAKVAEELKEEKIKAARKRIALVSEEKVRSAIRRLGLSEYEANFLANAVNNLSRSYVKEVLIKGMEMSLKEPEVWQEYQGMSQFQKLYAILCAAEKLSEKDLDPISSKQSRLKEWLYLSDDVAQKLAQIKSETLLVK